MDWVTRGLTDLGAAAGGRDVRDGAVDAFQGIGDRITPFTAVASDAGASAISSVRGTWTKVLGGDSAPADPLPSAIGEFATHSAAPPTNPHHPPVSAPATDLEAQSLRDELNEYLNLTWTQRILAFTMCFATGALMIFLSLMFLPMIVLRPAKFALSFTLGNLLAIVSTWFIVGPHAQLRSMFDPARATAAIVYLSSLAATLFFAIFGGSFRYFLVLVSVTVEVLALIWYSLSYIPYSRALFSRFVGLFWSSQ